MSGSRRRLSRSPSARGRTGCRRRQCPNDRRVPIRRPSSPSRTPTSPAPRGDCAPSCRPTSAAADVADALLILLVAKALDETEGSTPTLVLPAGRVGGRAWVMQGPAPRD